MTVNLYKEEGEEIQPMCAVKASHQKRGVLIRQASFFSQFLFLRLRPRQRHHRLLALPPPAKRSELKRQKRRGEGYVTMISLSLLPAPSPTCLITSMHCQTSYV